MGIVKFFFFFFEIHESALDSANVICKVQSSIILILKVGKLRWIKYTYEDVFAALTYPSFHHEHKVNKYMQMFSKVSCFLGHALSLLADRVKSTQSEFANDIIVSR